MFLKYKAANFVFSFALSSIMVLGFTTPSWSMEQFFMDEDFMDEALVAQANILQITSQEVALRPDSYDGCSSLKDTAPLTVKIFLANWNEDNADQIETALSLADFSNVLDIECSRYGEEWYTSKNIGNKGIISLASGLKKFPQLQSLKIADCTNIDEDGAKALGQSLSYLPNLKRLIISGNMSTGATNHLIDGLSEKNENLTLLDLRDNDMGNIEYKTMGTKIKELKNLKILRTGNSEAMNYLETMIQEHNPTLEYSFK